MSDLNTPHPEGKPDAEQQVASLLRELHEKTVDKPVTETYVPPEDLSSYLFLQDIDEIPPAEGPSDEENMLDEDMPDAGDWLIFGSDELPEPEDGDEDTTDVFLTGEPEPERRRALSPIGRFIRGNAFRRGDEPMEWLRKSLFWIAVAVLLVWCIYMLVAVWWQPAAEKHRAAQITAGFLSGGSGDTAALPSGALPAYAALYAQNPEVAGWLQFHASAEEDFLHIDSPLMYSGDNLKYMAAGVDGRPSAGGSLFFDARCTIGAGQQDKVRVIYGRDTAFGGALSGLSTLVGSVYRARAAASLSVSTLFRTESCAVFAVLLTDEDAAGEHYFNTRRMAFSSDAEFMAYVEAVRARSLFDYPVEVTAEDSLVVITTNAPQSVSKLSNARLTVFARVCHGDDGAVNTQEIVKNSDAIMPYAWYIRQGLTPHPYYTDGHLPVQTTVVTTTAVTAVPEATLPETTASTTAATTTTTHGRRVTTVPRRQPTTATPTVPDTPTTAQPVQTESPTTEAAPTTVTEPTEPPTTAEPAEPQPMAAEPSI